MLTFGFFSLSGGDPCIRTGYVSGVVVPGGNAACQNRPTGGVWTNIKLTVNGGIATFYIDDTEAISFTTHFPAMSTGGPLVTNGRDNHVFFRNTFIRGHI